MKKARNSILNAAMEIFALKGYAGSSIREICHAAGVTKPVLYYHFRSKEHLYQELMLDIFNQTRKNLLKLSKYRGPLRERLVLYVSSEFRKCRKDPDNVRFLFRSMFAPEGEYPLSTSLRNSSWSARSLRASSGKICARNDRRTRN